MDERTLLAQLQRPDPVGRDLALYRTRVYRFSDDHRHYALAEVLEERHIAGTVLRPETLTYVRDSLSLIRATGQVPDFDLDVAAGEDIDTAAELRGRNAYMHPGDTGTRPCKVVAIVGAPRSGTSHLFNLLARQGAFAYFTTVSCWAWPIRNLTRPGRRLFTQLSPAVLTVDNKKTRLLPALVMPYEAEDVFARALPTYRHVAGHRYDLQPTRAGDLEILHRSAAAHLHHFGARVLLIKSPFNSLRIPHLEKLYATAITYIHIVRDQHATADSLQRNRFQFSLHGELLSPHDAWTTFVTAVDEHAPANRTLTVLHRDLLKRPIAVTAELISTLAIM